MARLGVRGRFEDGCVGGVFRFAWWGSLASELVVRMEESLLFSL